MELNEVIITRAIIDRYYEKLTDMLEMDIAIVGGGPRMGPIFGGMLLSGEKIAKTLLEKM